MLKKITFISIIFYLSLGIFFINVSSVFAGPNIPPIDNPVIPNGLTNPALEGEVGSNVDAAKDGTSFFAIINGMLSFFMILAAIFVLMNLIQAGIEWIGAGGDSSKLENARKRITNAVIGIIVLASSVAIWYFVKQFLGFEVKFSNLFDPN